MKILLVQDTDWIRKNPIQHNHLMERLVLRGHEVRVIDYEFLWRSEGKKELFSKKQVFHVSRILPKADHEVIRPGILKLPFLDYLSMVFTYSKEIKYQIKEFKPDVVIGPSVPLFTALSAFLLARIKKCNFIFEVRDIWPQALIDLGVLSEKHPITIILQIIERFLYKKAKKIV